ncbi:MAG: HlyD family efflux transporter periplasmic adaptor subunit, partial [Microcystaceae cyanobacterium]
VQLRERNKLLSPRLESGKKLIAEGAIAPLSMDIIQAQKQVQDNDIQVTQMQVQSNDTRAKIEQLQSDLVGNQAKEKDLINQIRSLKAQLTGLGAQLEQIEYTTLQSNTDRDNKIGDLQRDIKNLRIRINTDSQVLSPRSGKILELSVNRGQVIQSGTRLATIEETPKSQETLAYSFFAAGDAEKIRPSMPLLIVPGVEDRERYGGIVAKAIAVAPMPSTSQEVTSILGNEELSKQILDGGKPVIKIIAQLKRDANTPSGFAWTRGNGLPYVLPDNTIGTAYLVVEERSLVSHLTPLLRRLTGIDADAN